MKKEILGELLIHALKKYNFKNYGSKLFYLELEDSIIILEQTNYLGGAEMYLSIIIKKCHPEISKITKSILKDDLLIDNHTANKLRYNTPNGYRWNFYDIDVNDFEKTMELFERAQSLRKEFNANVNFYSRINESTVKILTYERGVEDFTLACGTGSGAVATILWYKGEIKNNSVLLNNQGGQLKVTVKADKNKITALYLEGSAEVDVIYEY
jgi:hypothetical protein